MLKKENLIIYDEDEEYVSAFSEYINQLSEAAFSVAAFTNLESMINYVNEVEISAILLPEKLLCAEIISLNVEIFLLTDNTSSDNMYDFQTIRKYQAGDSIVREVSTYYAEKKDISKLSAIRNKDMIIYGVYSPIHRCGTTTFAITLAQQLGLNKRVLYINLEEFSGLKDILLSEYISDISDLMYFYLQNSENMEFKFKASIYRYHNMDYIPPMSYSADIRNIDVEIWCSFIKDISKWSDYEVIVLDIGNMVSDVVKIFSICNKIFMPFISDKISYCKMKEFKEFLGNQIDINERFIKEINIDEYLKDSSDDYDLYNICFGRYGNFVKKIIGNKDEYE
ncbi:MAG: hypothetical protein E7270_02900 [Lachnospiraceae bacterium]|nr:hypothetical protein [Lachnospiraceae bacterium]MBQ4069433.1 hypothetical protein [Lachnospiraceae bacterium]